ncbi:MAG: VWA domain-containing protein [Candidatus Babeliales bacterium]
MIYFLRFAQLTFLYILLPFLIFLIWLRNYYHKPILYQYSLATELYNNNVVSTHPFKKIFNLLRFILLFFLAFFIAKPQLVDLRSKVLVEGIDIALVLDISGSMQFKDYDERARVDVAKEEAIRFIKKREHDALGLVLFGKDTVARCPITSDKTLLKTIVDDVRIGNIIDPDGTMLITGMITAVNLLKHSKAKSKVMIVLTDGEPSDGDMDPSVAIEIAKRLGIKIYTVGIGSEEDEVFMHPFYGLVAKPKVNKELLTLVAEKTGGRYFMANSAQDMRRIYDTIDQLEKVEHDVPMFSKYYDIFTPFVFAMISLVFLEIILSSFVWFAL